MPGSDETKPDRKVISLFDGKVIENTILPTTPPPEPLPYDENDIQVLENILAECKAGRYRGVAVVAGMVEDGRITDCATFSSNQSCENALLFVGGASFLKRHLMDEWEGFITTIDDEDDAG